MGKSRWKEWPWLRYGLPSAFLTLIAALLVANLGDQQADIDYRIRDVSAVTDPQFARTMENMIGPSIVAGNRLTAYQNGDRIFPAMLDSIAQAKRTIDFESYIYLSGKVGERFVEALSERARAGVKVHLLIDWMGSGKIQDSFLDRMEKAGVSIEKYHPLGWFSITRLNNRTHRKILVIDGRIGFTGGVGISDEWMGNADSPDHWRDSMYRIVGPAVGQLQSAFTDNWLATSPEVLHDEPYFPLIPPDGPSRAQVFKSAPREGAASSLLMYLMSISAARQSILIANAYFVPGPLALNALLDARKRGVKIQIIVPGGHTDAGIVRLASRQTWGRLLEAGVEIFEYQPTMYHCKLMIVDGAWTSVGSSNFDDRSFRLNSEANLNVLDAEFAKAQSQVFADDLKHSRSVSLNEWRSRSWIEKSAGWLSSLLRTQL